jgi:hypothetical protein
MIYDPNSPAYARFLKVSVQKMRMASTNNKGSIGKQDKNCDDGRGG